MNLQQFRLEAAQIIAIKFSANEILSFYYRLCIPIPLPIITSVDKKSIAKTLVEDCYRKDVLQKLFMLCEEESQDSIFSDMLNSYQSMKKYPFYFHDTDR